MRVFQLARELKISSEALLHMFQQLGAAEDVKSHMSAIGDDLVARARQKVAEERRVVQKQTERKPAVPAPAAVVKPPVVEPPKPGIVRPAPPPPPAPTTTTIPPSPAGPIVGRPASPAGPIPTSRPMPPRPGGPDSGPRPGPSGPGVQNPHPYRPPSQRPGGGGGRPGGPVGPRGAAGGPSAPPRPGGGPGGPGGPGFNRGSAPYTPGPYTRRRPGAAKPRNPIDDRQAIDRIRKTISSMEAGKRKNRGRRSRDDDGGAEETMTLRIHEFATVGELASIMEVKPAEVIQRLFELGVMANINKRLDREMIEAVAMELGVDFEFEDEIGKAEIDEDADEGTYDQKARPPIVTVMGHVDHGKTSLLDYIRKTKVIEGEAGGITQHIGAYMVHLPQGHIAFLDTPGHEAFTAMRARGAQVTDIVILVVAADDHVRPQTIEAINHAKAANVPIIVAINKIDLPTANLDRVKKELADQSLLIEEWGGTTVSVDISAKKGTNVDKLLEMVLLVSELGNLKAEPDRRATGVVIESRIETGRGVVATVLVKNGTLRVGDPFVCGAQSGKVRAMVDERGHRVKEAGPSTPVEVSGWSGVPNAGDAFTVMTNESRAREVANRREQVHREARHRLAGQGISLESIQDRIKRGELKELNVVLKADVGGSIEVLRDTLNKLSTAEVKVRIIHEGVGLINESDVLLAMASGAIVVGFHTRPDAKAHQLALTEKIEIKLYRVIYELEKEIKAAMAGLLAPDKIEKIQGSAEVRKVFHITKVGTIAGCYVGSGTIRRGDRARVYRGADVVWDGKFASLKRVKDDVREVQAGFECGIGLDGYDDLKEGDVIESYLVEEVAKTLD